MFRNASLRVKHSRFWQKEKSCFWTWSAEINWTKKGQCRRYVAVQPYPAVYTVNALATQLIRWRVPGKRLGVLTVKGQLIELFFMLWPYVFQQVGLVVTSVLRIQVLFKRDIVLAANFFQKSYRGLEVVFDGTGYPINCRWSAIIW